MDKSSELVYHISPLFNLESIKELGIDPTFARGKTWRCYFVEASLIMWALAHVSSKFDVPVSALVIFTVAKGAHMKRWRGGVWYSTEREEEINYFHADQYVATHSPEDD